MFSKTFYQSPVFFYGIIDVGFLLVILLLSKALFVEAIYQSPTI
jgi:hypothetical protein